MTISEIERLRAALDGVKRDMLSESVAELLEALVPFVREALEGVAPDDYRDNLDGRA